MDHTRVLLVDDNILCRRIGYRVFSELGAQVACATTGEEAIQLASVWRFDIIVVDSALGSQSGLEVAKRLRRLGIEPESTAIIALTPTSIAELEGSTDELGIQAVLEKPLCGRRVLEAVSALGSF